MNRNAFKSLLRRALPAPLWTTLKRVRGARHLSRFPVRVVSHRYHGVTLSVSLQDGLAEGWYDHDWPEQPEITFLHKHQLKSGAVVFDCGAHQGVVALILAELVGESGKVIAIEALGHNARMAAENVKLNPQLSSRVTVLRAAVSDQPGQIAFTEDFSQNGHLLHADDRHAGKQTVEAITLDALADRFGSPSVIFVDIEGAELLALKGATKLLRGASKPDWFIEVHTGCGLESLGGTVRGICDHLSNHGYALHWCDPEKGVFAPVSSELPSKRFYLCALAPQ